MPDGLQHLSRSPTMTEAASLHARYGASDASELISLAIAHLFPAQIALVSSFGAESAVLLALVAQVDPTTPVIFLDTGKLHAETLAYRDALIRRLGLSDVRSTTPDVSVLAAADPEGWLWHDDPDRCCVLRKVAPLEAALGSFSAWISGRKRYHGGPRSALRAIETDRAGRIKFNPLVAWSAAEVTAFLADRRLPPHPLFDKGFRSIGCIPCTRAVPPGEDVRAGRWPGRGKTECGIHLSARSA